MNIQDKAMLVYLTISLPGQTKTDKRESVKVEDDNQTAHGRAKVVKRLFSKETIGPVTNAAQRLRLLHYRLTLAWDDTGARLLPVAKALDYINQMSAAIAEYNDAVETFDQTFSETMDKERERLGKLFNASDYPNSPAAACSAEFRMRPVPEGAFDQFGWSQDLADEVAQQAREDAERGMVRAMDEAYGRIKDTVGKMVSKLSDPNAIFRDSLLGNVQELADTLSDMNIFDDPRLSTAVIEIRKLSSITPTALRTDPDVRASVADTGADLLRRLQSI